MRKQPKKKNQNIYQIFGLNGILNIIEYKKKKIIRVDIMQGGVAERKSIVNKLIKTKIFPIHRLAKDHYLKKYSGKRTQGIVITFEVDIMQNLPSFDKSSEYECLLVIDNLEDPQNLGQLIRTAECANITRLLLPEHQ